MLMKWGFRWIDVYEVSRWTDNGDDTYTVDTAKNSNNRIIPTADIDTRFQHVLDSDVDVVQAFRYTMMSRYFNRHFTYPLMRCGNKQVSLHSFRYNIARDMHDKGKSDDEIKVFLGEVDIANARLYIYNELHDS